MFRHLALLTLLFTQNLIASSRDHIHISARDDLCRINKNKLHRVLELGQVLEPFIDFEGVFRFQVKNRICTATAIGESGLILTSMHCLEHECGEESHIPGASKLKKTCDIKIDGKVVSAEVIASGTCLASHPKLKPHFLNKDIPEERLDEVHDRAEAECPKANDFAILGLGKSVTGGACLFANPSPLSIDDPVRAVGFPARTNRKLGKSSESDGESQYITLGKISDGRECELYLDRNVNFHTPSTQKLLIQNYAAGSLERNRALIFPLELSRSETNKALVYSTVDLVGGMSGGPTTDEHGDLRAVNTGAELSINQPVVVEAQCIGNSHLLPLSSIFASIREQGLKPEELFDCPKKIPDQNWSIPNRSSGWMLRKLKSKLNSFFDR